MAAISLRPGRDEFRWIHTPSATYSAASAYQLQFTGAVATDLQKTVWSIKALVKCKLFLWLLEKRWLLTADVLLCCGWPNSYFCQLCRRNLETMSHLCFDCPWAREVWEDIDVKVTAPSFRPSSWPPSSSPFDWFQNLSRASPHSGWLGTMALITLWEI